MKKNDGKRGVTLPDPNFAGHEIIDRAKRLGTYNQVGREQQYGGPERARPEILLADLNANWDLTRALQKSLLKKDIQLELLTRALRRERTVRKILAGLILASLTSSTIALAKIVIGMHR